MRQPEKAKQSYKNDFRTNWKWGRTKRLDVCYVKIKYVLDSLNGSVQYGTGNK